RGHGCCGTSARASRNPRRVIGVTSLASECATTDARRRVFVQIRLPEDDRSRLPELRNYSCITRRFVIRICRGSAGRRAHVEGIKKVLYGERNAVKRPDQLASPGKLGVELSSAVQSIRNLWIIRAGVGALHPAGQPQRNPFVFL